MSRRILRAAPLLVATLIVLVSPAHAYRTLQDDPALATEAPVTWAEPHAVIGLSAPTLTAAQRQSVSDLVANAANRWAAPTCSAFALEYDGLQAPAAPGDGRNTVEWVPTRWSSSGFAADAAATTDVQLVRVDGGPWVIVEADVYIDGSRAWRPLSAEPDALDLSGALTHELGHVLGLAHPCEPDGTDGAPLCSSSAGYLESVVYPIHAEGPGRLGEDDVLAVCSLYPQDDCADVSCAVDEVCADGACELASEHVPCGARCAACLDATDCAGLERCAYGQCLPLATIGQQCAQSADCESDLCLEGRCTRTCSDEDPCPNDLACDEDAQLCVSPRPSMRGECSSGDDCASLLCVLEPSGAGYCTNECDSAEQCFDGERCGVVAGESVCVLRSVDAGCSATTAPRSDQAPVFMFVLALAAVAARRRRVKGSEA